LAEEKTGAPGIGKTRGHLRASIGGLVTIFHPRKSQKTNSVGRDKNDAPSEMGSHRERACSKREKEIKLLKTQGKSSFNRPKPKPKREEKKGIN